MKMVAQTVLPFKLGITGDTITPHAGLALFGEFLHGMAFPGRVDGELPPPGSGAGYDPSQVVVPLVLMLHGGGRTLEDLRQVRGDEGLRELLGMDELPSSDATGDWLRRMGAGPGLEGLAVFFSATIWVASISRVYPPRGSSFSPCASNFRFTVRARSATCPSWATWRKTG